MKDWCGTWKHGIKCQTHVLGSLCPRGSGRMFSGWWFPTEEACILKWRLDQRSLSWIKGSLRLGADGNLIPKRKRWHLLWSVEYHEPLEGNSNSHVVCCVLCVLVLWNDGLRLQKTFWLGGLLIWYITCHRLPETINEPFFFLSILFHLLDLLRSSGVPCEYFAQVSIAL